MSTALRVKVGWDRLVASHHGSPTLQEFRQGRPEFLVDGSTVTLAALPVPSDAAADDVPEDMKCGSDHPPISNIYVDKELLWQWKPWRSREVCFLVHGGQDILCRTWRSGEVCCLKIFSKCHSSIQYDGNVTQTLAHKCSWHDIQKQVGITRTPTSTICKNKAVCKRKRTHSPTTNSDNEMDNRASIKKAQC